MESCTSDDWATIFRDLRKFHDEAYRIVENAIQLEEEGKCEEAIVKYNAGLSVLDKALSINIECPSNPDITWEKACAMVQKMKKTRKEILSRIADSQMRPEASLSPSSLPPSYEEAMSSCSSSETSVNPSQIQTYRDLGIALQNLKIETAAQSAEVLFSCPSVKVYYISANGTVTGTLEPETLKIVELIDGEGERPRAYLSVGDWIYPLVPGVSPCLRTAYGAFVLPDLHSKEEGSAVGIILPEEVDSSVCELLSDILQGLVTPQPPALGHAGRRRRDLGFSISQGIVKGAQYLSRGMVLGAEKTGQFMNYGTPKLLQQIKPEENPTPINPKVRTGLEVAKNVTGGAVAVTGFIASRIGAATMALGRYLAPHVQRQGTKLLSTTCNYSEQEASQKMGSVLQVAAGAVEGFATVYDGLENAAKILGTNLTANTVKIVQHKYGHPAGEVAGNTLYTVGNVFVAGNNVRHLTPKGLAKFTAKQTGKGVVDEYRGSLQNSSNSSEFKPGPSSEVD